MGGVRAVAAKNKAGRDWLAQISEIPECLIAHFWPAERINCGGNLENNHLNCIANRSRDDLRTIRICFNHHQAQSPLPVGEAYHKGSRKFREKYGTDDELLEKQKQLMELHNATNSIF